MQNKKSIRKIMSVMLMLAMAITYLIPMSVSAAVTAVTAIATVVENDGGGQTKTVTVSFNEKVISVASSALDTDISVTGKTFGASTISLDADTEKDLIITLADDADVEVGDSIEFINDVVVNAEDTGDVFNGNIEITGSLECATIDYSEIKPADAQIKVTGYAVAPTSVGTGTFYYELTKNNYITKTGSFTIDAEKLGTTYKVTDTMEKVDATYTFLDNKITEANGYSADNYTADSFAALTAALAAANGVDRTLKIDDQDIINDLLAELESAINNLVAIRKVDFMAVGVSENVADNYGKATKLVLVFAEPIDAAADAVLANLSVKDMVESAAWADGDNTVLNLALKANADITNSLEVTYTANEAIKTKLTPAVVDTKTVTAIGNFVGNEQQLTANNMAATIVKGSARPGVAQDDKIIIVFNAPVKDVPASIIVNGMTANVVAETSNTVYQIVLDGSENINNNTTLNYAGMTTSLKGSFGNAEVPKALRAYAIDNDGTELVAGDMIVVQFNVPTNGANDISKVKVKGNGYVAALGESQMSWDSTKTKLKIELASDAFVKDGVEINLKNLGIKDIYETVDADADSLVLTVDGSFGYTVQPRIVKTMAFSQGTYDYIRVFFNTKVKNVSLTKEEPTFNLGFEMGVGAEYGLPNGDGSIYYEIKMNKNAHSALKPGTTIALSGIADNETGSKLLSETPYEISGAFVSPITPEVVDVVALSQNGSGVAQSGDKILVIFNVAVEGGNITLLNNKFGDGNHEDIEENVLTITLGEGTNVKVGDKIRVSDFVDSATMSAKMKTADIAIGGTFGKIIEPEIISATAISNDGSGIPKVGDKILVVFNTEVKIGGDTLFVYEYKLKDSDNLTDFLVGKEFKVNVTSAATGASKECSHVITGTYGLATVPSVKSVVLSEQKAGEVITVIFDSAIDIYEADGKTVKTINNETLKNNNKRNADDAVAHIGDATAQWKDEFTMEITLGSNTTTTDEDTLNISGLGIKAKSTGIALEDDKISELAISGTLIPIVKEVKADKNSIVINFSARTNGAANISNLTSLLGTGAVASWDKYGKVLTITLGENYTITSGGYIVLNGMGICDAFSGKHHVVGQYKVSGSIETGKLEVSKIVAQSMDKSKTTAQKGDVIVVKFNSATNLMGAALNEVLKSDKVDEIISVAGGNEATLGTGYTGVWTAYDTLVITLGGAEETTAEGTEEEPTVTGNNPTIEIGTEINVANVAFANGEGKMDTATVKLSGSFNGREFVLTEGKITRTGNNNTGDYRVEVKMENTLIKPNIVPTVVCVAYNGINPVCVTRINIAVESEILPVFEFAEKFAVTNAKIYVFDDVFGDINSSPNVLAETMEIK